MVDEVVVDPAAAPTEAVPAWRKRRQALWDRIRKGGSAAAGRGRLAAVAYWLLVAPWRLLLLLPVLLMEKLVDAGVALKVFFTVDLPRLPGMLRQAVVGTGAELASAEGRRQLRRSLFDEDALTARARTAALFLAFLMLFVAWLVMELMTLAWWVELISFKRETDLLLFYGIGTRLFLPTPFEIMIPRAAQVMGAPAAVLVASIGATIGSWLLFLMGAKANEGLKTWFTKRPRGLRFWNWMERNAARFGYLLMGIILAIPFAPDAVIAFFALLGLKMRWFLVTIFLATVVRLSVFLWFWG